MKTKSKVKKAYMEHLMDKLDNFLIEDKDRSEIKEEKEKKKKEKDEKFLED